MRRLSSVEASVLDEIDMFGGYQPTLFEGLSEQMKPSRLSVVIEGFDDSGWPFEYLQIVRADVEVSGVEGLEHYPNLTVARLSQELANRLKTKTLTADGNSDRMFNWTFSTKDKLRVFLELKFQVCTCTKDYEVWQNH
jgi:hypothetical protein